MTVELATVPPRAADFISFGEEMAGEETSDIASDAGGAVIAAEEEMIPIAFDV